MTSVRDLLQIEQSIVLRAPRSRVWRALTDKEQFAGWFQMTLKGDFVPGGRVTLTTTHAGFAGLEFPLYVQHKEPETFFSWRWIPGDAFLLERAESQMTEVSFKLEDVPEGTRLTVTETGFDQISLAARSKSYESNTQGWEIQLGRIQAYVRSAT
jgi:uncharacterized protein YndB with AHSA1/START domain